jgi:hypothetical protein
MDAVGISTTALGLRQGLVRWRAALLLAKAAATAP